jgi:hypothetical protein
MSEPAGLQSDPQTASQPSPQAPVTPPKETERDRMLHSVIVLCSAGIIGCFFLPWVRILFGTPSGYDLQQLPSNEAKLIWAIPVAALLALLSALAKQGTVNMAQVAGGIPFVALVFYRIRLGDGFFQLLQVGAYLTLALSAILFVAPRFLKKSST